MALDQPYYTGTTWAILSPDEKFFDTKYFEGDGSSVIKPLAAQARLSRLDRRFQ